MSDSSIEWTDKTWNPVTGCTKVSPGCKHCYAEGVADRFWGTQYPPIQLPTGDPSDPLNVRPRQFTDVLTHADRLDQPLRWKKPARIFVNSMSDLFHEDVPDSFIGQVFTVMSAAKHHTFQILTKRAHRMRDILQKHPELAYPNVWLGVSVENQEYADERIPLLLQTPAAVRFISAEPLLGPVDMYAFLAGRERDECLRILGQGEAAAPGLDWVIVGGESGPGARPFELSWARSIVHQCHAAGVACFMKQLGADPRGECSWPHHHEWPPQLIDKDGCNTSVGQPPFTLCHAVDDAWWPCRLKLSDRKGGDMAEWPEDLRVREFPYSRDEDVK